MRNFSINFISDVQFEGIDYSDAPDFSDAHIVYALYEDEEMNDAQLEELNNDSDLVYELLMRYIY